MRIKFWQFEVEVGDDLMWPIPILIFIYMLGSGLGHIEQRHLEWKANCMDKHEVSECKDIRN